jgi:hypothetical protein
MGLAFRNVAYSIFYQSEFSKDKRGFVATLTSRFITTQIGHYAEPGLLCSP